MDERIRARRRAVARRHVRRRRTLVAALAVTALLIGGGVALGHSPLAAVERVTVTGATGDRSQEVRERLIDARGQPLLSVDTRAAAAAVTRVAWVADAQVSRRPPATLRVEVEARQPVATLETVEGAWALDADGVAVDAGAPQLPRVVADEPVAPMIGRRVDHGGVRAALQAVPALPRWLLERVEVVHAASADDLVLRLADGPDVRLGDSDRIPAKVDAVVLVFDDLRERGGIGEVRQIDVRVPENPTLRTGAEDGASSQS